MSPRQKETEDPQRGLPSSQPAPKGQECLQLRAGLRPSRDEGWGPKPRSYHLPRKPAQNMQRRQGEAWCGCIARPHRGGPARVEDLVFLREQPRLSMATRLVLTAQGSHLCGRPGETVCGVWKEVSHQRCAERRELASEEAA